MLAQIARHVQESSDKLRLLASFIQFLISCNTILCFTNSKITTLLQGRRRGRQWKQISQSPTFLWFYEPRPLKYENHVITLRIIFAFVFCKVGGVGAEAFNLLANTYVHTFFFLYYPHLKNCWCSLAAAGLQKLPLWDFWFRVLFFKAREFVHEPLPMQQQCNIALGWVTPFQAGAGFLSVMCKMFPAHMCMF